MNLNFFRKKSTPRAYEANTLTTSPFKKRLSVNTFYQIYRSNGDVFSVIRELSENIISEGYEYTGSKADITSIEKIFDLTTLKSDIIQSVMISGNAYLHIERGQGTGKPIGVTLIDPRTMSVVTDQYGTILKWIQKVKGQTQDFTPDEIAHWYIQKDPDSPVFGLSNLEPIFWEVMTDNSAMLRNYAFFENGAVPASQYILDDDLSDEEAKRAIEALKEQIQGATKAHKSIAVRGIKDIKTFSVSMKDMEFSVLRKFTTEKVCSAYGVPKAILNYTDGVNYATAEAQVKKFWQGTIIPLENKFKNFLNKKLFPKIGLNVEINIKPRTFEDREWNEASTRADLTLGIMTINEVREKRGLEPLKDDFANMPIIFGNAMLLDDIGIDTTDLIIPDTDKAKKEIERIKKLAERYDYTGKN